MSLIFDIYEYFQVIHASPVTISRESYMGVEKLSCYVTWNSVVNILVDQHRDPIIEVDSVDHPVTCQKLIETASNATKTIIGNIRNLSLINTCLFNRNRRCHYERS